MVNLKVFNKLQQLITGWPAGGKPHRKESFNDTSDYFEKQAVSKKTILIFSPHPDDDVICMGN